MKPDCAREQDVIDALASQRWPDRCDDALKAHVSTCAECTDLADVAAALLDDRESAWAEARVPQSGMVWWRAQIRAREEAARAAARPIAFIQGVAASCAVWLAVALLRAFPLTSMPDWRGLLGRLAHDMPDISTALAGVPGGVLLLIVAGASLLFAPVAIFLALREE